MSTPTPIANTKMEKWNSLWTQTEIFLTIWKISAVSRQLLLKRFTKCLKNTLSHSVSPFMPEKPALPTPGELEITLWESPSEATALWMASLMMLLIKNPSKKSFRFLRTLLVPTREWRCTRRDPSQMLCMQWKVEWKIGLMLQVGKTKKISNMVKIISLLCIIARLNTVKMK